MLLAAAITTRTGKTLVSRQFVDVSRVRIEGLLAAFPKLMSIGSQHTFVEGESVRYVYHPLEQLYLVLVTTKASNMMDDLDTLAVLAKLVPEYCRTLAEDDVLRHAYELIMCFDEAIHLGLREKASPAQIQSYLVMDSHEEKIAEMVERNKQREAAELSKRRMQEISRQKKDAAAAAAQGGGGGRSFGSGNMQGFGSGSGSNLMGSGSTGNPVAYKPAASPTPAASSATPTRTGLTLKRAEQTDAFLRSMAAEGEEVAATLSNAPSPAAGASSAAAAAAAAAAASASSAPAVHREAVHLIVDEKLVVRTNHDGGVEVVEIKGGLSILVGSADAGRIHVQLRNLDQRTWQFKAHPNTDRALFTDKSIVGLRDATRSFPTGNPLGVLKWRVESKNESDIPITVSVWPSPAGSGATSVVADFELTNKTLELHNLVVAIPIPGGAPPRIETASGSHSYNPKTQTLLWHIDMVDASAPAGSMEFTVQSNAAQALFPVQVSFRSPRTICPFAIAQVTTPEGAPVKYSSEIELSTELYTIS